MSYATTDDLREWMDLEGDNLEELLQSLLDTASSSIDDYCGRTFTVADSSSTKVYVTENDPCVLQVDDFVGEVTATSSSGVELEVEALPYVPPSGRPQTALSGSFGRRARVEVEAPWGWPQVPVPILTAELMVAARLWDRRQSPGGVLGTSDIGVIRVTGVDRDVQSLLEPYVKARGFLA